MAKYHVFVRVEPAHIKGKGADRGDVVSIRPASAKVTDMEKRKLVVLEVEMTEAGMERKRKGIRPSSNYVPITEPPDMEKEPDKYVAWELACREEQSKLANFGLKVDFDKVAVIKGKLADIDDMEKKVAPITVTKSVFEEVGKVGEIGKIGK